MSKRRLVSGAKIRNSFLKFFSERDHKIVPSSSLIPAGDPTLLFTNAGMVQFKDVFLGKEKRAYDRAVSAQKCVRAGGKHNDLDMVGRTGRHHTFFEMLGNFSFGDYFKREAICYAWEFLTSVLGLEPHRLWVTVYEKDDEARTLWIDEVDLPPEKIVAMGEKDNFWSMGETGPCGPCSEIIYDRGPEYSCSDKCGIGLCSCDRWLELWNLVFMQYERDEEGNLSPLPRPSIDTGMGLERIASVLQDVGSNFETDLILPVMREIERISGMRYEPGRRDMPFRVIADHSRACTFLVGDGVVPSNEGRGYVLRRILRRAVRFGKSLGLEEPFLHRLVPVVASSMEDGYPELKEKERVITEMIKMEEERFFENLEEGTKRAEEIVSQAVSEGRRVLTGEEAFLLYDTYGFPLDLADDIAEEHGLKVDHAGFERQMELQRRRARQASRGSLSDEMLDRYGEVFRDSKVEFTGYDRLREASRVIKIIRDGEPVPECVEGEEVLIVLDRTPFYGEAGGQVGDTGVIRAETGYVTVEDTLRVGGGQIVHRGEVIEGTLSVGDEVSAQVDERRRWDIMRHHTATHLIHKALKLVLGDHVSQSGSLVLPSRLRFDFTHFRPLTGEELRRVEDIVNGVILDGIGVEVTEESLEDAKREGAVALFGEKYGERVRVVRIGDFSKELCGGTHVPDTAKIGLVRIISESSIGSGLRRIEAVAGYACLEHMRESDSTIDELCEFLKSARSELSPKIRDLVGKLEEKEREIASLSRRLAAAKAEELLKDSVKVDAVTVVKGISPVFEMDSLRSMVDVLRDRIQSGIIVIGAAQEKQVNLVCGVTADLAGKGVHAGRLVSEVAKIVGGGGGGRAEMAQAGGKKPEKLNEALQIVPSLVRRLLAEAKEKITEA